MDLRTFFARFIFILAVLITVSATDAAEGVGTVRIGLTPTIPNDQYRVIEEWRLYMERELERPVEFVWRNSYIETMDLLRVNKLDYAWICDYPFVYFKGQVKLLAVPLYQGRPYYQSYLIVPATDDQTTSIDQLRGKMFAYADPYSNTGYLTPRYLLAQSGEDPDHFFSKTFFTFSHRKVMEAVALGAAQGGAVSSHVWDTLLKTTPELAQGTRVVSKSPEYGFPPLVARPSVSETEFRTMQKLLLKMMASEEGQSLLRRLNIDGFIAGEPSLYDRVDQMMQVVGKK
ncbi:PhnD/SsuA/transferrin family substrate-binding protein [Sedimenticola selenatireducens]|uniref:substrate-binding domain-containing protein n=1 Tax=Sedimenticola selenatireducens TaxID=191960 RepID=UPI0004B17112|nr:PhnD/SsuA/transferrin family substrate-binding protein [Sedimenticola selenatireducens]